MADALAAHVSRRAATPQQELARADQVKNNAGGFVFGIPEEARLHRFLTIGTEGGTYHVSERDLTRDNAKVVTGMAAASNPVLVNQAVEVSQAGRAPSNNPALFALAAASGLGAEDYRAAAFAALPSVARTGHHLITFAKYMELFRGWGPQAVKGIGRWYTGKEPEALAYQLLKYKSRDGWAQRDILRLANSKGALKEGASLEQKALFHYVMKGELGDGLSQLVLDAEEAHRVLSPVLGQVPGRESRVRQWVRLIEGNSALSWEMLPSEALSEPDVWRAMITGGNLPQGALIRQLSRLTNLGVLKQSDSFTNQVAGLIAAPERLKKARVHPIAVLLALKTYASGHSARGDSTWNPVPVVTDALDAGFYSAFPVVTPAGNRIKVSIDVSGTMGHNAGGLPITCRELVAAMSLVTVKTEPLVTTWAFSDTLRPLDLSSRRRIDDILAATRGLPFSRTDCALPMVTATKHREEVDVFQVWTDNETWYGKIHPYQALEQYRQASGIDAKLQVIAVVPTEFSIADPLDPRSMDVSGFDAAVPVLLADHARGDL